MCRRRDTASKYLTEYKTYHLKEVVTLLEKTVQKKPGDIVSNYSMAANLGTRTIHLYYQGDFSKLVVISLRAELKKGAHQRDMNSYFKSLSE